MRLQGHSVDQACCRQHEMFSITRSVMTAIVDITLRVMQNRHAYRLRPMRTVSRRLLPQWPGTSEEVT
jgi:hypothetical protein